MFEELVAILCEQLLAAASDYKELLRLTEEKEAAEAALTELMERWESVSAQLEL